MPVPFLLRKNTLNRISKTSHQNYKNVGDISKLHFKKISLIHIAQYMLYIPMGFNIQIKIIKCYFINFITKLFQLLASEKHPLNSALKHES